MAKDAKPAEKDAAAETPADGTEAAAQDAPRKRFAGKKLILFVVLPAVLLIGGGAGAFMMMGRSHPPAEDAQHAPAAPPPRAPSVFMNIPEMIVNLNTGQRRTNFLKINVSLELTNQADVPRVEALMPRIVDTFQVYLRELRVEDLRGSAGMFRLREELLARVNHTVQPVNVTDVLFREILVQ